MGIRKKQDDGIHRTLVGSEKARPTPQEPPEKPRTLTDLEKSYTDWLIQDHHLRRGEDVKEIRDNENERRLVDTTWVSAIPIERSEVNGHPAFVVIKSAEVLDTFGNVCSHAERVWSSQDVSDLTTYPPRLCWSGGEFYVEPVRRGRCDKCGAISELKKIVCRFKGCSGKLTPIQ
jgi:hypothetical protein